MTWEFLNIENETLQNTKKTKKKKEKQRKEIE